MGKHYNGWYTCQGKTSYGSGKNERHPLWVTFHVKEMIRSMRTRWMITKCLQIFSKSKRFFEVQWSLNFPVGWAGWHTNQWKEKLVLLGVWDLEFLDNIDGSSSSLSIRENWHVNFVFVEESNNLNCLDLAAKWPQKSTNSLENVTPRIPGKKTSNTPFRGISEETVNWRRWNLGS